MQHGGREQNFGWHSTPGYGQQGGKPRTFSTRTHAIATINTINFINFFKKVSIITKLSLQIKIKWIFEWCVEIKSTIFLRRKQKIYLFIDKDRIFKNIIVRNILTLLMCKP